LYGLSQAVQSESGLMTMVMAGLVLRASSVPEERLLRRFKGQLTILAVSVLFILLSADLSIASIVALGRGAIATVALLMFVVRPVNIWLCTWNSTLNWRQKLFLAWVAPKGIVSASVASLFAILLTERGISGGEAIKALVFLTIISTVSLQGLTAGWVARWLKITSNQATGAVIVGCNPISRLIARLLQDQNESVVLIDTDEEACRLAEADGFTVFISSALDMDVLEQAGLGTAGTFLAITNNSEVNTVLAERAVEEFNPPRTLVVAAGERKPPEEEEEVIDVDGKEGDAKVNGSKTNGSKATSNKANGGKGPKSVKNKGSAKVHPAFAEPLPLKLWNGYVRDGAIKLGETTLQASGFQIQKTHLEALIRAGEMVPILREREKLLQVVQVTEEWQPGDRILYLLHDPRPKLLRQLSGGKSPSRLAVEKLPSVEELPIPTSNSSTA
ncbi:MAG: cation:proton antiporter, partial [Leptolyngbyaceae cyanobacterium]